MTFVAPVLVFVIRQVVSESSRGQFQRFSREDDLPQVKCIKRAQWRLYARAGSNTAVRVTAITLMSSC